MTYEQASGHRSKTRFLAESRARVDRRRTDQMHMQSLGPTLLSRLAFKEPSRDAPHSAGARLRHGRPALGDRGERSWRPRHTTTRDGGVDCVAYGARPIFGGKVVIQAKRYKNTVGVSAVRDLFGTMQNEGATKGILVATSGYGKASHEFANGKPLELIDGGNLLFLLQEHAGIEAKIEVPEDWVDPELPS
jgi:hypothetical protein